MGCALGKFIGSARGGVKNIIGSTRGGRVKNFPLMGGLWKFIGSTTKGGGSNFLFSPLEVPSAARQFIKKECLSYSHAWGEGKFFVSWNRSPYPMGVGVGGEGGVGSQKIVSMRMEVCIPPFMNAAHSPKWFQTPPDDVRHIFEVTYHFAHWLRH